MNTTSIKSPSVPSSAARVSGIIREGFELFNGVENRFVAAWKRYSMSVTITEAGGATSNRFRLRNVTNNAVGVVEKLVVSSSAAADTLILTLSTDQGALPLSFTAQRLDGRIGSSISALTPQTDTQGGPDSPQTGLVQ